MDKNAYKANGWRDNTKRDRTPSWKWLQIKINKAHTSEEWTEIFRALPPKNQIDALLTVNPVPKEVKMDQSSTFQLIISGLQNKVIESKVSENKALEGHEEDDP